MHNDTVADNRILAAHGHRFVLQGQVRFSGSVRLQITEITRVMFGRVRRAMRFVHRVEMPAGGRRVRS